MTVGPSAGYAVLDLRFRLAQGQGRQLAAIVQRPLGDAGEQAARRFGSRFSTGLKVVAAGIAAGLAVAVNRAVRGIVSTVRAATDLGETVNKVNVIFGRSAPVIQRWARGSATAMGLSRREALANAASFGDMFLQLNIGRPRAVAMSQSMVKLAADFASFHNADITQVLLAQQSAFRGEYDAVQRFVPGINAARVQAEALRMTHKRSAKDLTDAEKAQAAFNIMMRDGRRASGDFQRTQGSLANQQRILRAQWEDMRARLGSALLPVFTQFAKIGTTQVMPMLSGLWHVHGPAVVRILAAVAHQIGVAAQTARVLGAGAGLRALLPPELAPRAREFGEAFRGLGPRLAEVARGARSSNVQMSSLPPLLNIAGAAAQFLAQHSGFLARNIGLVIGALVAYKAIQGVVRVAQAAQVALLPLQIAGNFALARSNRALAASMRGRQVATVQVAAAENLATVAATRGRIATLATAAAGKVAAVATRAWAIAWRLLNVALLANPIGLVVAALGLLAVLIVRTYQRSETFRKMVDRAWQVLYRGARFFAAGTIEALRRVIDAILSFVGITLNAAVKAFGWVPGIGPKLRGAAVSFNRFKDQTNRALGNIRDRVVTVTAHARIDPRELRKGLQAIRSNTFVGMRRGGVVTGGIPGRDSVALPWAMPGEVVVPVDRVRYFGGPQTLMRMLGMRGARGQRSSGGGEGMGFQAGGVIPQVRSRGVDRVAAVAAANQRQLVAAVTGAVAKVATAVASRALTRAASQGSPAIKRFILSTDRLPYRWGAAGPLAYDCSGIASAVYGLHTRRGGGRGQRYFTTATVGGAPGLRRGLGGILQFGVTPGRGHMVGRYAGLGFEARSTATGIFVGRAARRPEGFARHYYMARGGVIDERIVAALQAAGFDIAGDQGRTTATRGRFRGTPGDRVAASWRPRGYDAWMLPGMAGATGAGAGLGADAGEIGRAVADALAASPFVFKVDSRELARANLRGRDRLAREGVG